MSGMLCLMPVAAMARITPLTCILVTSALGSGRRPRGGVNTGVGAAATGEGSA